MHALDPRSYGPRLAELLDPEPLPELGPGRVNRAMRPALEALSAETAFSRPLVDRDMALACLSGLWLLHGFLDESHSISQSIHNPTGSFWHAIMHRREPDYANAKYWFRRVGQHPVFQPLAEYARGAVETTTCSTAARKLASRPAWDPLGFVDLVEAACDGRTEDQPVLGEICRQEWRLLFDFCHRGAVGLP
jgi:hypothetical protein